MILFLSTSFLSRIRFQWKPSLQGFLIGDRNLFFFYPELLVEAAKISPQSADEFLRSHAKEEWRLLGFLSPEPGDFMPGYAELITGTVYDPGKWNASIHLLEPHGSNRHPLEIRIPGDSDV